MTSDGFYRDHSERLRQAAGAACQAPDPRAVQMQGRGLRGPNLRTDLARAANTLGLVRRRQGLPSSVDGSGSIQTVNQPPYRKIAHPESGGCGGKGNMLDLGLTMVLKMVLRRL